MKQMSQQASEPQQFSLLCFQSKLAAPKDQAEQELVVDLVTPPAQVVPEQPVTLQGILKTSK